MKFGRSNSATATADQASEVDELQLLEQQRARLDDRVRTLDADTAELLSERSRKLLAGEDVTGPIGTASLREERDSIAGVIATLDTRIAAIKAKRAAAEQAAAQRILDEAFAAAREKVEAERNALHSALRGILFATWRRAQTHYEVAVSQARAAAKAAGHPTWNPPDKWKSLTQANVAHGLDRDSNCDATNF